MPVVRPSKLAVALLGLLVVVGLVGCGETGSGTVPVKGTLTIGGQPADNVQVTFSPTDATRPAASGNVTGGKFELFSGSEGHAGAVPGKYKVVLAQMGGSTSRDASTSAMYGGGGGAGGSSSQPAMPKPSFPEKYLSPGTSDKEVEVTSGSNEITIDIPKE